MATTSVRPPAADVVGRQFVRDPDTWLLLVAAVVGLLSVLQLFLYPMGRSLAEFAVSGRELLLGGAPAKTYWSLRAPGIAILHAGIQATLGSSTSTMRAVEIAFLLGLAFVTTKLLKKVAGFERVGSIAAALTVFVHAQLEYEHTGQPEFFAACFVACAAYLTLREPTRHDRFAQFAGIGCLLGIATLFVPLFALLAFPLGLYTWRAEGERGGPRARVWALLVLKGSLLLPLVACALWLLSRGALRIFYTDWLTPQFQLWTSWSAEGFLEWSYFVVDRFFLRQSAILPAGCLVAFTLTQLHHEERQGRRLLLWIVLVMLLGFALSGESNPGRLSGALPFLSMLAAIGLYKLYRRLLLVGPAALTAFWSGLFLLGALNTAVGVAPGSYWWRSWTRLRFMAGAMPYRASELLEGALYANSEINLTSVRRVQSQLSRMPEASRVLIQGDEPMLLWARKQRPAARLIRPLPEDMSVASPELDVKLSEAIARLAPSLYVTSPWAAAMPHGSLATRLGPSRDQVAERSTLVAVTEGWAIWVPKPSASPKP